MEDLKKILNQYKLHWAMFAVLAIAVVFSAQVSAECAQRVDYIAQCEDKDMHYMTEYGRHYCYEYSAENAILKHEINVLDEKRELFGDDEGET